jgi:hypothetical protein
MARGWESKSVESQIEERDQFNPLSGNTHRDAEREREMELLEMTRKRLVHEIAFASTRRFREMKQRALSHIESKISEFSPKIDP